MKDDFLLQMNMFTETIFLQRSRGFYFYFSEKFGFLSVTYIQGWSLFL